MLRVVANAASILTPLSGGGWRVRTRVSIESMNEGVTYILGGRVLKGICIAEHKTHRDSSLTPSLRQSATTTNLLRRTGRSVQMASIRPPPFLNVTDVFGRQHSQECRLLHDWQFPASNTVYISSFELWLRIAALSQSGAIHNLFFERLFLERSPAEQQRLSNSR